MNKPKLKAYEYHAVFCCGNKCVENGDRTLFNHFRNRLMVLGMDTVRVNRAGCLGVCEGGPIMVVYPGGHWYCGLNEAAIDRIIENHFRSGEAVEDLLFHKGGERFGGHHRG